MEPVRGYVYPVPTVCRRQREKGDQRGRALSVRSDEMKNRKNDLNSLVPGIYAAQYTFALIDRQPSAVLKNA